VIAAENNAQWYGLEMNYYVHDGLWREPKAKQALLYSIDRQAYVDAILMGYGTVRHSFYDGSAYACPTMIKYDYNPEKAEELWDEIGLTRDVRSTMEITFMSWLGMKARLDYLPIAQEYLRQMGFRVSVDIIDNALVTDYINGDGPRGKDWSFHVLLFGPGVDPGGITPFMLPDSRGNWGYRSWPERPDPTTGEKSPEWVYDNPRVNELLDLAAKETDPQKRMEYFQEIDCIWNVEHPALVTASPMFLAAKTDRMQGIDWQTNAELGLWTSMYRPQDWWVWGD